ncbi:GroES-like protein [Mycena venus]|uniref:GroES-like protein n=1 Tax=Mycena venus TaxID=2733690 RepID=A0A8H6XBK2_9AGAR|nr:GroES-like protein [Mycena venus]
MSQLALVYGADLKQTVQSQPIPEPSNGFVQVRVEVAAFNPVDYKIYDGLPLVQKYPTVLGGEGAGEVTKIGPGVTKFKVGDRVTFMAYLPGGPNDKERGAFQQYALADVRFTAKIPNSIDYDSASSFPVNGNTAAGELYGQLKFTEPWLGAEGAYKGEKIVILGGSSSVGSYTIQFAVLSGLEVITTSSPAHFDYLKSLGATAVIDRSAPDAAAQILAAAGGPVKYVVDAISLQPTQLLGVEILQHKGKLVLVLPTEPSAKTAAEAKDISLLGGVGHDNFYFSEPFWNSVGSYLERGAVTPNRITVLPRRTTFMGRGFRPSQAGESERHKARHATTRDEVVCPY